jgi:hypothetical protein
MSPAAFRDPLRLPTTRAMTPLAVRDGVADAFLVLVTHCERHLGQAERARRAAGG